MKCEIKKIIRKDRNNEGKPYINKNDKPYTRVSLQITEEELEQRGKETELLADKLIESLGVEFWDRYFNNEIIILD